MLGIAYRGVAVPVMGTVLNKAGNANTAERIALMERFLALFGRERMAALARAGERGNSLISDIMKQPEMLSSEEMAKRLGVTRDTVNRRREEGRLLGLSGAKRGFRYPAWQLDRHGKLLMGLAKVVEAAGDPWSAYRWLTATHPELKDISGLDALRQGKERELVELIEQLGETFS